MRKNKIVCSNSCWHSGQCDVCNSEAIVTVCSSLFGATSYAYCQDCFDMSKEPYQAIVDYIASAGRWPEDINETYQREVRRQLRLHSKQEEIFKFAVDSAIAEERAFIQEFCSKKVDLEKMMSEEEIKYAVENLFS